MEDDDQMSGQDVHHASGPSNVGGSSVNNTHASAGTTTAGLRHAASATGAPTATTTTGPHRAGSATAALAATTPSSNHPGQTHPALCPHGAVRVNVLLEDIFRNAESRTAADAHEIRSLRAQLQRSQREKHLLFARTRRFQERADGQAAAHEEEILRLRGENDGLRARFAQVDELVGGLAEVKTSVVALKEGMEAVSAAMRRE